MDGVLEPADERFSLAIAVSPPSSWWDTTGLASRGRRMALLHLHPPPASWVCLLASRERLAVVHRA